MRLNRRQFLVGLAGSLLTPSISTAVWKHETEGINVSHTQIKISRLKAPLRIAHLSDLHASEVVRWQLIEKAIDLAIAENPDLICLTGDYGTGEECPYDKLRDRLKELTKVVPGFACLGNHDGTWVDGGPREKRALRMLQEAGFKTLYNEAASWSKNGADIQLVGMADYWAGAFNPSAAFQQSTNDRPVIVLCHNPDGRNPLRKQSWDLMLSGHTHGGQVNLPFAYGAFAPVNDKTMIQGLHAWQNRQIYITSGVGSLYGIRFRAAPEVSILNLVPA